MLRLLFAFIVCCAASLAGAQPATDAVVVVRPDGESRRLATAELRALPRETVHATFHDKPVVFTGSDLREVLRAAGVEPERLHGGMLRRVVLVQAADGYAAAFAAAELDPSIGDRRVYLVDRNGDAPLAADEGPWRVVVPRDGRPARSVRQVTRISVIDLPARP